MHPVLEALSGEDRRSIGESNRIASLVVEQPKLLHVLAKGLESDDPVLRMRCADAMEKATVVHHELLIPYKKKLIRQFSKIEQQEVRWHVAPMLARLKLSEAEADSVLKILLSYTNDRSSIVKTMAMQAIADMAISHPHLLPEAKMHIEELTIMGTPAMQARGRKLLLKLSQSHSR